MKHCYKCNRDLEDDKFYENQSKCKECDLQYRIKNKNKKREYDKKYRKLNKDKIKKILKTSYETNKEYRKKKSNERYFKNKYNILKKQYKYKKERLSKDPAFKLKEILGTRLYQLLTKIGVKKSQRTIDLCGCSILELKLHLESKFQDGMSWDNYGKWHVDHIRPCSSFNLTDPDQQKQCFYYTNLQPLWAKENISKGSLYKGKRYTIKNGK